ncbi:MAG: LysE family transporter [Alphaproteobacteria bacterium]|nr:LysE family transporter [Alphaproteobacteria bacterium]
MDWLTLIAGGLVIGIIAAAPIGPANIICIRRTLAHGQLNGFLAGLGAAIGDGVFAVIAGFSVKWVFDAIEDMGVVLKLLSAALLMFYGARVFIYATPPEIMRNPDGSMQSGTVGDLAAGFASTFALTITNPATMVGFATMFAAFREVVDYQVSSIATLILVLAAFIGSVLWWFTVTAVTGIFHKTIESGTLKRMNQASGLFIFATGAALLGYAVWQRLFA